MKTWIKLKTIWREMSAQKHFVLHVFFYIWKQKVDFVEKIKEQRRKIGRNREGEERRRIEEGNRGREQRRGGEERNRGLE